LKTPLDHLQSLCKIKNVAPCDLCVIAKVNTVELMQELAQRIIKDASSDEQRVNCIVSFVANHFYRHWRHPLTIDGDLCTNPIFAIITGYGQCTTINRVAADLLEVAGFESRVLEVASHIAAMVRYDSEWRLVDPFLFSARAEPMFETKRAPLMWLMENPDLFDVVPCYGDRYDRHIQLIARCRNASEAMEARMRNVQWLTSIYQGRSHFSDRGLSSPVIFAHRRNTSVTGGQYGWYETTIETIKIPSRPTQRRPAPVVVRDGRLLQPMTIPEKVDAGYLVEPLEGNATVKAYGFTEMEESIRNVGSPVIVRTVWADSVVNNDPYWLPSEPIVWKSDRFDYHLGVDEHDSGNATV
jgi:hypothetical protein